MIIERLKRPNTPTKDNYNRELMDALERFSYETNLYSRTANVAPSNIVYVSKVSDLPKPKNGIIYPEDLTQYALTQDVVIPYSIDATDKTVQFTSLTNSNWIYNGGGDFFIGEPFYLDFIRCSFVGIDDGIGNYGTLVNISRSGFVGTELFLMRMSRATGFDSLGKIQDLVVGFDFLSFFDMDDGIEFENSFLITLSNVLFTSMKNTSGCIFVSAKGITTTINISSIVISPQSNEDAFYWDKELTAIGRVSNVGYISAGGDFFASNSLQQDDIKWAYSNATVTDSTVRTRAVLENNALTTTISAANTPVPINSIWTNGLNDERMRFQDPCTFDGTTDKITTTYTHGLSTDDVVPFWTENGGTLPTGLSAGVDYYVITDTATTFQVSATAGGSAIDFTGNGTADQYYRHTTGNNKTVVVYIGLEDVAILAVGHLTLLGTIAAAKKYDAMVMKRSTTGTFATTINGGSTSPTNTRFENSPFSVMVELSTNEGIALYVENHTDATNVDITDGVINIIKI